MRSKPKGKNDDHMAGPSGSQTHHADAAFRKSALVAPGSAKKGTEDEPTSKKSRITGDAPVTVNPGKAVTVNPEKAIKGIENTISLSEVRSLPRAR